MKNFFKTLLSIFCAMSVSAPTTVLANTDQEFEEVSEEQEIRPADSDNYSLTFLNADFVLSRDRSDIRDQAESLIIFVADPLGKIVKDAQVVTTIVGPYGDQLMRRAHPYKGGYVINTKMLTPGTYRVETEIATNGWLLTDEFNFLRT
jgi:hypothetical protein